MLDLFQFVNSQVLKMAEHAGCVVMCDIEKISCAHKLMLNFCFNIDSGEGGRKSHTLGGKHVIS